MKILARKTVVDSPFVRVFKDVVLTDKGTAEDYYVAVRGNVALIAAVYDGKILLIREHKQGAQQEIWQLPGGRVESEDIEAAAARELREETGLIVTGMVLLGSWFISADWRPDKVFVFQATVADQVCGRSLEDTETIVPRWVGMDLAVKMVYEGKIQDPHSALSILLIALEGKLND